MDVIGIIQARMSSSRLPGKILAPLAGLPLLAVLVERVRPAAVGEWWLATSARADDEVTAAWGDALGLRVHRGDLDDVLSRFTAILRDRRPEWMLRLTADSPFVDAGVVDALLEASPSLPADQAVLGPAPPGGPLPLGYVPQLARADAVLRAEAEIPAGEEHHRAHVLSWFSARGRATAFQPPPHWPRRPAWRWTVDCLEDLDMARRAFAGFGDRWRTLDYPGMVGELDRRPEVTAANAHVRQRPLREG